ncbi:MAG: hypothetical protein LBH28_05985 [Oscillospiraceae bacterium]|jgi:hypothetical protein|nr:hypothetical protein [Oscillospiraceae bacterium]
MSKENFELALNTDLNGAKEAIDEMMGKMGFSMSYPGTFEGIAQRGSGLSSALMGPFAGKNNIAVKFGLSYRETGGQTFVILSDAGSGLGKTLTLTGGATKKVMQDVYNTLREGASRKGILA